MNELPISLRKQPRTIKEMKMQMGKDLKEIQKFFTALKVKEGSNG